MILNSRKFRKIVIRFTIVSFISITLIFLAKIALVAKTTHDNEKLIKDSIQLRLEALEYVVEDNEKTISQNLAKIDELETINRQLQILSKLNDCGICGSHDLSYIDDKNVVIISCNKCYTHVDFEKKYLISQNKIQATWNGLKFRILRGID